MAQISAKYESLFILRPDLTEEQTAELVQKFKDLVSQNGTLLNVDEWGKRRLAYLIDDYPEGYYVLMVFESKPDFPAELSRIYNITDNVMRGMTTVLPA